MYIIIYMQYRMNFCFAYVLISVHGGHVVGAQAKWIPPPFPTTLVRILYGILWYF